MTIKSFIQGILVYFNSEKSLSDLPVHIEPSAGPGGEIEANLPSGDIDLDVKTPDAPSGSLKAKGKGGFKFPSFNRKDKKPKVDIKGPGKLNIYCLLSHCKCHVIR